MNDRYIVTTTVYDPKTGTDLAPVSLDSPGVTRDLEDARRLRNDYILTIAGAGAIGSPARLYPAPAGDREAWVVEYLSPLGAKVTMRETVTFLRAADFAPHMRHIERGGTELTPDERLAEMGVCPRCGNSGTTPDFLDTHTCVEPGTQHVDLLDDPWNQKG